MPYRTAGGEGSSAINRRGLDEWFSTTPGRQVVDVERRHLERVLPNLFGYYLLQVGQLGGGNLLASSRILHRVVIDIDTIDVPPVDYPTMRGRAATLPVESHSVDVVLLPHVLEFEQQPHEALRESFRVLVPEGHLLICGFNPWSLLGAWGQVLGRRRLAPWCGRFLPSSRIKDWLSVLGFDVLEQRACFFKPPFRNERVLGKLEGLETAGAKAFPFFAGVYVILARKRVTTLTLIRPQWKPNRRLVGVGLVGPSARVIDRERAG